MVCHELHFFKCEMLVFTIVFDIGYWLKPFEVMKKMILLNQYVSLQVFIFSFKCWYLQLSLMQATNYMFMGAEELERELEVIKKKVEHDSKKKDKGHEIKVKELIAKNGELYLKNGELKDKKEELEKVVEECDGLKILLDEIEEEAKKISAIFFLETRMKMMDDLQKNRVDRQDKEKWERALNKLKGEEWVSGADNDVDESVKDVGAEKEGVERSLGEE